MKPAVRSERDDAPHTDLAAERGILGGCFLRDNGATVVSSIVKRADFAEPAHAMVFAAILSVLERGDPVDTTTVRHELLGKQLLNKIGGTQFLRVLTDDVAVAIHLEEHARRVAELAWIRRTVRDIATVAQQMREPLVSRLTIEECVRGLAASVLVASSKTTFLVRTAAEVAATLGNEGPPIATGFATFDAALRGGPRAGTLLVMGGAPQAGKTTFACNIAANMCERGVAVGILAADESTRGLVARLGQRLGFDRDRLGDNRDDRHAREKQMLVERLAKDFSQLLYMDAGDGHTVESAVAALRKHAGESASVLVVDSIQRVRSVGLRGDENDKQRIDTVMGSLLRATRPNTAVIAISEVNRTAYKSTVLTERGNPLASFKESGSIEYWADVAIVLGDVRDSSTDVDVILAKNRLRGPDSATEFRIRIDRVRAVFDEVPRPAEGEPRRAAEAAVVRREKELRERVLAVVRANPSLTSKDALIVRVKGNRTHVSRMINALLGDGSLVKVHGAFRIAGGTGGDGGAA